MNLRVSGRRSDIGQGNKIASQLLGSCHVLVGERQIRTINADRHHSQYREGRGIGRLLRRGCDSVAINAVRSAAYRLPANRLQAGRHQETEAVTCSLHQYAAI